MMLLVMCILQEWNTKQTVDKHSRIMEGDINETEGAVLKPNDIVRVVLYLGSKADKYVNSHNLIIKGGFIVKKLHKLVCTGGESRGGEPTC
jgi:hypothetical protein